VRVPLRLAPTRGRTAFPFNLTSRKKSNVYPTMILIEQLNSCSDVISKKAIKQLNKIKLRLNARLLPDRDWQCERLPGCNKRCALHVDALPSEGFVINVTDGIQPIHSS
jgi:hypothetical protein